MTHTNGTRRAWEGWDEIIEQEGAFGLDEKVPEFEQIGKLQTEGPLSTLPYCWFSAIDTWDNPSLCAVDTYDAEGGEVRFRSRGYNCPDLVPVAKTIEYVVKRSAEKSGYRLILAVLKWSSRLSQFGEDQGYIYFDG